MTIPDEMTTFETARLLGLKNHSCINRMIRQGKIKAERRPRARGGHGQNIITRENLMAFLATDEGQFYEIKDEQAKPTSDHSTADVACAFGVTIDCVQYWARTGLIASKQEKTRRRGHALERSFTTESIMEFLLTRTGNKYRDRFQKRKDPQSA